MDGWMDGWMDRSSHLHLCQDRRHKAPQLEAVALLERPRRAFVEQWIVKQINSNF
jgi:hypothetical protein